MGTELMIKYFDNSYYKQMLRISLLLVWTLVSLLRESSMQSCQASHHRTLVGGVCVCMDGYYESGSQNCPNCATICLTCVTTSTTCTSCDATLYLTLSGATCICMDGYVMVSGVCQPCHYSCQTCSGVLSTQCISCNTTIRQLTASFTCICLNGTYDNTTLMSCQPCNIKCLWCSASTSSDCTACDSNLMRAIGGSNPGPCPCIAGYYDTAAALCPQCSYTCATCSITATTCLTCNSAYFRSLSGTSCLCIAHYYEAGAATCSMCSPRCGNCSISASTCLTCNNTLRVLTGTNCPCISGYYQDAATIACLSCTSYCLTCENTSSTCLSCYSYGNRALYNATCACVTGYYDNGTIMCQPCPYSCTTCSGPDPPACTSCSISYHRTLSGGQCPCDAGYYDSGVVMCQPCHYSCLTCSSSAIMCTACSSAAHRTQVATDCNCTVGSYDNGVDQLCPACHYSCVSCFGGASSQCYTCQANRNYTNYSCPCNTGMYELAQLCYNCDSVCATCTLNSTFCTSCPISRTLVNGTCVCAVGYYASGLSCLPCHIECRTCVTSSTSCTSCNPAFLTVLYVSSCICPTGYYKDPATYTCFPCHYSCLTCLSSVAATDCQSCAASAHRTLTTSSTCPCDIGYFDPGTAVCVVCHPSCTSCVGPSNYNCTACATGFALIGTYCRYNVLCPNYLYENNCISSCPEGSYGVTTGSGNTCVACANNCRTCSTSSYCLTCARGTFLDSGANACISYCSVGYYLDASSQCTSCPTSCVACTLGSTGVVCTQCVGGLMLEDGGDCVSVCGLGSILVADRCHHCVGNCLTCSSLAHNGCLTCMDGYSMLAGSCYKMCPSGYSPVNGVCVACQVPCSTCLFNACLSCSAGYYISSNFQCVPLGYFRNALQELVQCHPNCKSCTDTSFSSCVLCSQRRGDQAQLAISGYCECKQSSVDTGDGKCDVVSYQGFRKANEVIIGGTQAMLYLNAIVSVISVNFVPLIGFVNYLQVYSSFYYLNSSAVMQTDKVLESYKNIHPLSYYRSIQQKSTARLLVSTQTKESLFLRGRPWLYLSQWAFPVLLLTFIIWTISFLLLFCQCCCRTKSNKIQNSGVEPQEMQKIVQKKCSWQSFKQGLGHFVNYFKNKYHESVAIIVFLLTYSEITTYSAYSFQMLLDMQLTLDNFQLDVPELVLSIVLAAYYFIYLLRLLIGVCRAKDIHGPLRLLFHQQRSQEKKSKLARMFLPILLARNIGISVLIVILSYRPNYQIFSSLGILILSLLVNFCICPYRGAIRVYFHLSELLLIIQVAVLAYIVALPESSRVVPSQALICINFLQLAAILAVVCWTILSIIVGKLCAAKTKKKGKQDKKEVQIINEESLSNLAEKQEVVEKQVTWLGVQDNEMTVKPDVSPYESAATQKPQQSVPVVLQTRSEKKITKKYRVKTKI